MAGIETIGVAGGGGTMGSGIAIVAARGGFATIVYDVSVEALARAERQIASFLDKSVARQKLTEPEREAIAGRLSFTDRIENLAEADLIIEAVFEDLEIKRGLFAALNRVCPEGTIFASNTSTLSITEIAGGSGRPDRCVGMHFCLPAQLMKLVEVSPGLETSEATLRAAWQVCEATGQQPVKTRDTPGFVLNYFVVPFNNDVIRMVESGVAAPADIDAALTKAMGWKMGPCTLLDLVGLDTQMRLCEAFYEVTHDARTAAPPLLRRMVAAGRLGRKTGHGFYRYDGDRMFGG